MMCRYCSCVLPVHSPKQQSPAEPIHMLSVRIREFPPFLLSCVELDPEGHREPVQLVSLSCTSCNSPVLFPRAAAHRAVYRGASRPCSCVPLCMRRKTGPSSKENQPWVLGGGKYKRGRIRISSEQRPCQFHSPEGIWEKGCLPMRFEGGERS